MREKKRFLHIGQQQCVHSFFSIRENQFLSVSSVFYLYQTTPHKYGLASCANAHRLASKRCYPNQFPLRRCASLFQLL